MRHLTGGVDTGIGAAGASVPRPVRCRSAGSRLRSLAAPTARCPVAASRRTAHHRTRSSVASGARCLPRPVDRFAANAGSNEMVSLLRVERTGESGVQSTLPVPVVSPKDSTMADEPAAEPIRDIDRDSLYILPLAMIPMQTPALRRARLIKNVRLDGVVELFEDAVPAPARSSRGCLPHEFNWRDDLLHPDLLGVTQVGDVTQLRRLQPADPAARPRHQRSTTTTACDCRRSKNEEVDLVHDGIHPAPDR